ncbi:DNA alkylation repair protein [Taylorella equigenitalis]|uniref:DNA alkylation repair protein n=1 Tax=Taylorella equigenitalis TaxID=29575 RepID=UPI000403E123|nr:DNA alkylation repair protein [Taylorella equigenitalis]ASY30643.1 DNA alkylation repair protein [Taylorella equigenitalis]KOS58255.1 DNA alkylation repair protein [Taylorella equigenitalis]
MRKQTISKYLSSYATKKHKAYMEKLIPHVDRDRIMGVPSPIVKRAARDLYYSKGIEKLRGFLDDIPHFFIEESNTHAYILNCIEDIELQYYEIDKFLPEVDNWWTCDVLKVSSPINEPHDLFLQEHINKWLKSEDLYAVRFGIVTTMNHYLQERFDRKHLDAIVAVNSGDYFYLHSAVAWFFCTALIFQWDEVLPYITEHKLPKLTHNYVIIKCRDSTRISDERKKLLDLLIRKR